VWRCTNRTFLWPVHRVVDGSGRIPDVGLAYVVASGLDVAGR
jgi:hypothetical protein